MDNSKIIFFYFSMKTLYLCTGGNKVCSFAILDIVKDSKDCKFVYSSAFQ